MMEKKNPSTVHEHVAKRVHVLLQRAGVPYEVERKVCADCARVLDETTVRRTAA
jgi:NMD protein affecting ribosome stability and mRNA decay